MKKCFTLKVKYWKVMKICSIQAMLAITLCSLAFAHNNHAQVLDKKITLTLKEVSIEEALDAIEAVTDVKFFYSVDQLNIRDKISFVAIDRSLRDLLDDLLTPYQIKYKVHERRSTITLKKENEESNDETSSDEKVNAFGKRFYAYEITGKVTDAAKQQPMAGVNVLVKGTVRGTVTDNDGNYAIAAEDREVLVFSFIGYETYEVEVTGRTVIDISMEEDVASLKEVVVNAGYYQVNKRESTGNIAKVTAKEIEKQPVYNPLQALQGRMAGVYIEQRTGVPGGNFNVRIRGQNSIANGNDPLYIIDGVPFTSDTQSSRYTSVSILGSGGTNPLNSINPANIESIEILKDADATAIYGSRGANGVVLITTKKGKPGDLKVDLNFYTGGGKVANKVEMLNTQQYLEMRNEAFANDGVTPTTSNARDLLVWDTTRYTDWQDELLGGTANVTDAQLSFSGGTSNMQYRFGGGYHRETTVFPGDNEDRRVSGHLNISNTSQNQKFQSNISVNYSANNTNFINQDLTSLALQLAPNAPALYTENGDLNWENSTWNNPLSYLEREYESKTTNLVTNATLGYEILPGLLIKSNLGYTSMTTKVFNSRPKSSWNPAFRSLVNNVAFYSNNNFETWIIEPQLSWQKKLGNSFLNVLIGSTFQDQRTEGGAQYAQGFTSESLMKDITAASLVLFLDNNYAQYRYTAFFGRVNYTLNEKYIINLTGRRDGSSRFGSDKQFANFGALGLAWVFSNEQFMQNGLPFISYGKLRASYGVTGNDQLGDYNYLDSYTTSGSYQGIVGLRPIRLSNPDFAWETNRKFEGGVELGFIDDRVLFGLSYFRNRSSDQLVGLSLPPTTGFTNIQSNLPAIVENIGWEIELNTTNFKNSTLTWSTSINITVPHNKLIEFPNLSSSPQYANRLVVGEPLTIRKLYHYQGVDPQTGIYQLEDVNSDGSFSSADQQTTKNIGQKFYGGFGNRIQYKGFELDIMFQFVKQTGYNSLISNWGYPGSFNNQPIEVLNRWRQEGDITDMQRFTSSYTPTAIAYYYYISSDEIVFDASFIRLKNLSLAYHLPNKWSEKLHVRNAKIFLQGMNLLTITGYSGVDPETQLINLPPLRTITGGVSIGL